MSSSGASGGGATAFAFGTAAARPAAALGNAKTAYYATDTGELTISDGAAWNALKRTTNAAGWTVDAGAGGTATYSANNFGVKLSSSGGASFNETANSYITNTNIDAGAGGVGFKVAEGANAKQGVSAAMVAGSVVIANTSITANSRIQVTRQEGGTNPGAVFVSARVAGASFTVVSTNAADTGTVAYEIFEPG